MKLTRVFSNKWATVILKFLEMCNTSFIILRVSYFMNHAVPVIINILVD